MYPIQGNEKKVGRVKDIQIKNSLDLIGLKRRIDDWIHIKIFFLRFKIFISFFNFIDF